MRGVHKPLREVASTDELPAPPDALDLASLTLFFAVQTVIEDAMAAFKVKDGTFAGSKVGVRDFISMLNDNLTRWGSRT